MDFVDIFHEINLQKLAGSGSEAVEEIHKSA